ncbi:GT4 family glycosyltransferase PelF [Exiguobacterium sp. SL-9]|uniref:GT4 family glycosyltransferase PelF n=1 Tax=Exiguobacterium sp. SL-9 TaxID=2510963 RepID=UPI00103B86FE|nr:GT4 family glycosyltransferase PelF [Exiguobacterium sp. SL-9]TCI21702.1 DUF3492 domain-containing protein [Exiguobacterium sp. SL-9]
MKIGIVVEGSYPYVSGGVSSWVHMLMQQMPMHEFEIISIMPNPKSEADYRYTLPENVTGVTTLALNQRSKRKRRMPDLTPEERERIKTWMTFGHVESSIYPLLEQGIGTPEQFFSSRLFYQLVTENYQEEGQAGSFINYFWMWRSMYAPVLDLLQAELPRVDVVHAASTGYAGLIASAMKERQEIPFFLTEHGIYSREREEELLQASWIPAEFRTHWIQFFHHLSREAYRKADEVITLFERNSELQRQLGAPTEKLSIIPNGIDVTGLSALGHIEGDDKLRIGAIVRVVPIKDIKTMIYAAKLLQDMLVPFELTIMGPLDEDREYAAECQTLIRQLELEQHVFLVGKVDIRQHLPRFDVCLLTSISEGQPLAVLEGMAAGVPWIVTDVGACAELVNGRPDEPFGPAGFVVPPVNPRRIAERCVWFYQKKDDARKLGRNGQQRVETYYRTDQFIEAYVNLYEERSAAHGGYRL